ncbi:DUF4235 domain-containing protein [Glutamicibacter halophytocola]|uniref:DUF4235 domain-containing protein n=1 Tax=Glutamicibacter halophytocola TaxID=1933880 RepID=UPI0020A6DA76|nr:DUF4235 domain-containing protein [Glutamicibacter halophytocola]
MRIPAPISTTFLSLGAGWLGSRLASAAWRRTTGEPPPSLAHPEEQQQAALGKVLSFAAVSRASAAAMQALAKRWSRSLEARGLDG